MLNKALIKEYDDGLPGTVYYLWGEESLFLDDSLSRFIDIVIASNPLEFNYDVFDSDARAENILDASSTLPFMSSRRLVALKNFHQYPAAVVKSIMPYLKAPSDTTCMVILSQKAPKVSWKADWKTYSLNITQRDIPVWLKHTARKKGIELTGDAVDYLIECMGYEVGLLMMEIEKLALSGKKKISGKDIMELTSMMRKYTSFDLIDSLISGQQTRAFRILKTMFERNDMEAPVVLGTLNWHYRQFYSLWTNKGKRPAKMREKAYRALLRHLPRFQEEDFYVIFKNLHEADVGIKTSGRSEIVIETLMIKLLQKGTLH